MSARAMVMIYDDSNKRWMPSGSSAGLSKVHIYHHSVNNTFRVVGRKLQDHEVVINCAILKGLKYNQATVTFHQWRDNRQVYGLNFGSKDEADNFAQAMLMALETLSSTHRYPGSAAQQAPSSEGVSAGGQGQQIYGTVQPQLQGQGQMSGVSVQPSSLHYQGQQQLQQQQMQQFQQQQQQQQQLYSQPQPFLSQNGNTDYTDDQSMTQQRLFNEPYATHQRTPSSQSGQTGYGAAEPMNLSAGGGGGGSGGNWYESIGNDSSLSRVAIAPPTPPAPPGLPPLRNTMSSSLGAGSGEGQVTPSIPTPPVPPPPPPPPPSAPTAKNVPTPPPLPPTPQQGVNSGGLAAALKNAQLRKVSKPEENVVNYAAVTGTIGRGGVPVIRGSEDVMSEMARRLKERRARADGGGSSELEAAAVGGAASGGTPSDKKTATDKGSTSTNGTKVSQSSNGSESPKQSRSKRFQSLTGQESFNMSGVSNDLSSTSYSDLEAVKQEILAEVRKEINQAKQDIIDAIKSHLSRQ